jgi:CRP/FNR family transcriptional regulator
MIKNMLKNIDMFSSLNENEIDKLSNIISLETFQNNNILFYEGDEPKYFYFLFNGHLKLYKTGIKSQEIVLHYFTKPSMIAEMATLENFNFPATCISTKDGTQVGMIKKEQFMNLLTTNTALSFQIIKSLTKKIKNLEVSINRNLIFDATTKVCSILQENPTILQTHKNVHIANLLNITPETLSRTISKLKKLEILNSKNEIINFKKLNMFLDF